MHRRLLLASSLLLVGIVHASCSAGDPSEAETATTTRPSTDPPSVTAAVSSQEAVTDSSASLPSTCSPPEGEGGTRPGLDSVVSIALFCGGGDEARLVERIVPAGREPVEAIVEQLFLGVTALEAEVGLSSAFSSYTAGEYHSVQLDSDGVVAVDLTPAFVRTNNFSTTHVSMQVFTQISRSLSTVAEVSGVELAVDGERWCGWEAGPCEQHPRPLVPREE